jgi:hypothetical protein
VGTPSKDFFYYLRVFFFFILYPVVMYLSSFEGLGSPDFIFSSTLLFFIFLLSVIVSLGALVDLKKSLEEKSTWTALFDLLFFFVFVFTSSLALSYFVREVVSQIFSKVY